MDRNKGSLLWDRAKQIIPGGNQLLSKRAEQFLPDHWPAYYQSAKGCLVQDLDGKWYRDFSIMGIGTCSLGYANQEVNDAVISAIQNGSMSTLNCYEEVQLAEALTNLHPWVGGVRFARSGGESCSIAIRIARAYTGRDVVLFSGYHGWHDWYLATNLADGENLNSQLLPGLEPAGVPSSLTGSVFPFMEGDIDAFDAYIENYKGQIGAVMMEIWRYQDPDLDFIHHVQKRCQEEGIILIFDEISSGFRLSTGGSHSIWDLEPDICILGKALGNGHPIGAVIGRDDIMDAAQSSFISSSYWTERVGFAASLKVLEIFERDNIVEGLKSSGSKIKNGLNQMIKQTELDIKIIGVDSVPIIAFGGDYRLEVKTLFTQEMLKRGFLAGNVIYVSHAHKDEDIESYLDAVSETLDICQQGLEKGFAGYLHGPVCHSGFQRLSKS